MAILKEFFMGRKSGKIREYVKSKGYDKLKKYDIEFLYEDLNPHNCFAHIGFLLGHKQSKEKSLYRIVDQLLINSTHIQEPENNCVVVYYDQYQQESHYGLYRNGKVTSKWGKGPNPVFSHTIESFIPLYRHGFGFYRLNKI